MVELMENFQHTIRVVDDSFAGDLGVGEKGVGAEVVGSDPEGVDGGGWVDGRGVEVIGEESGEFVFLDRRVEDGFVERDGDGSWGEGVGAYGA